MERPTVNLGGNGVVSYMSCLTKFNKRLSKFSGKVRFTVVISQPCLSGIREAAS